MQEARAWAQQTAGESSGSDPATLPHAPKHRPDAEHDEFDESTRLEIAALQNDLARERAAAVAQGSIIDELRSRLEAHARELAIALAELDEELTRRQTTEAQIADLRATVTQLMSELAGERGEKQHLLELSRRDAAKDAEMTSALKAADAALLAAEEKAAGVERDRDQAVAELQALTVKVEELQRTRSESPNPRGAHNATGGETDGALPAPSANAISVPRPAVCASSASVLHTPQIGENASTLSASLATSAATQPSAMGAGIVAPLQSEVASLRQQISSLRESLAVAQRATADAEARGLQFEVEATAAKAEATRATAELVVIKQRCDDLTCSNEVAQQKRYADALHAAASAAATATANALSGTVQASLDLAQSRRASLDATRTSSLEAASATSTGGDRSDGDAGPSSAQNIACSEFQRSLQRARALLSTVKQASPLSPVVRNAANAAPAPGAAAPPSIGTVPSLSCLLRLVDAPDDASHPLLELSAAGHRGALAITDHAQGTLSIADLGRGTIVTTKVEENSGAESSVLLKAIAPLLSAGTSQPFNTAAVLCLSPGACEAALVDAVATLIDDVGARATVGGDGVSGNGSTTSSPLHLSLSMVEVGDGSGHQPSRDLLMVQRASNIAATNSIASPSGFHYSAPEVVATGSAAGGGTSSSALSVQLTLASDAELVIRTGLRNRLLLLQQYHSTTRPAADGGATVEPFSLTCVVLSAAHAGSGEEAGKIHIVLVQPIEHTTSGDCGGQSRLLHPSPPPLTSPSGDSRGAGSARSEPKRSMSPSDGSALQALQSILQPLQTSAAAEKASPSQHPLAELVGSLQSAALAVHLPSATSSPAVRQRCLSLLQLLHAVSAPPSVESANIGNVGDSIRLQQAPSSRPTSASRQQQRSPTPSAVTHAFPSSSQCSPSRAGAASSATELSQAAGNNSRSHRRRGSLGGNSAAGSTSSAVIGRSPRPGNA